MSHPKLRVIRTELDNLISNLRGEVGEIITTWTMLRFLIAEERRRLTDDVAADMQNRDLAFVSILRDKMQDEIVARLSELASAKIGRLTFHFAAVKLNALDGEEDSFRRFIQRHRFEEKRNYDISHKELPEQWSEHRLLSIPYRTLVRGVARASALMKKFDRIALGPSAPYLWYEMRKKRYSVTAPPSAMYLLLPHLRLSNDIRARIVMQEMAEGREVWSEMETTINGNVTKVYACKKWGVVLLGERLIPLDRYPLRELAEIKFDTSENSEELSVEQKPIVEQRNITAKFKVREINEENAIFTPVQRLQLFDAGAVTELPDICIKLNTKTTADFGGMKVGDLKEFTLTVNVITGYETTESTPSPSTDA